jgi:hypothetical protein
LELTELVEKIRVEAVVRAAQIRAKSEAIELALRIHTHSKAFRPPELIALDKQYEENVKAIKKAYDKKESIRNRLTVNAGKLQKLKMVSKPTVASIKPLTEAQQRAKEVALEIELKRRAKQDDINRIIKEEKEKNKIEYSDVFNRKLKSIKMKNKNGNIEEEYNEEEYLEDMFPELITNKNFSDRLYSGVEKKQKSYKTVKNKPNIIKMGPKSFDENKQTLKTAHDKAGENKERTNILKKIEEFKEKNIKGVKKSQLCMTFGTNEVCKHAKCRYAHTITELKPENCLYGDNCKIKDTICVYIHPNETKTSYVNRILKVRGIVEPKSVTKSKNVKKKDILCEYVKSGLPCPHGDKCRFRHEL